MIYVVESTESLDDLAMGFVFFKLFATDRDHHCVHAEARSNVCGVGLNIVNLHTQSPYSSYKILKADAACKFEMDLKVV